MLRNLSHEAMKQISVDPQADTSRWEEEIDQMVAPRQLYGLTEHEVKIVEGKE